MKKISILTIIMFVNMIVSAQGFYINAGGGATFPFGSQQISFYTGSPYNISNFQNYDYTEDTEGSKYEQVYVSLGEGKNFDIGVGYMFTKTFGFELNSSYLSGNSFYSVTKTKFSTEISELNGSMLQFKPTTVFTAGFSKINPYAKVSLIIGKGKIFYNKKSSYKNEPYNSIKIELDKGVAIGASASLGVSYNINSFLSVSGEISYTNLTYEPTRGTVKEMTHEEENVLNTLPANYVEFELVDKYTSQIYPGTNKAQVLKYNFPFSNFGTFLYLTYKF